MQVICIRDNALRIWPYSEFADSYGTQRMRAIFTAKRLLTVLISLNERG